MRIDNHKKNLIAMEKDPDVKDEKRMKITNGLMTKYKNQSLKNLRQIVKMMKMIHIVRSMRLGKNKSSERKKKIEKWSR